jgi:phosphoribosyl-ATP pyrophosphohydrolase
MNDTLQSQLQSLYDTIATRKAESSSDSYSAQLMKRGTAHIAKKLGEEAVETAIAASTGARDETVKESADVLFHLLALWVSMGITPADVASELKRREGTSGLAEKASRSAQ